MRRESGPLVALLAICAMLQPLDARASSIELKTALQQLLATLPGEYDSEPQRFFEAEYKTPPNEQHARVYRAFTRIDAPDVGAHVLVGVGYDGDKYGTFKDDEFRVWTLEVDDARHAVRMTPWKFRNPADYVAIAGDAGKLKGLQRAALMPATGPSGCTLYWRVLGDQLRGQTEAGECQVAASQGKPALTYSREWLLNQDELWINVAARSASGKLVEGRADQTHWRLGKARSFECFYAYRPGGGAAPNVQNGIRMHDRGDVYQFKLGDGEGSRDAFIMLIRGMWPSNSGRNYLDLLRLQVFEGRPKDEPDALKLIGTSIGSVATDRVGFASQSLSARCKLAQPN